MSEQKTSRKENKKTEKSQKKNEPLVSQAVDKTSDGSTNGSIEPSPEKSSETSSDKTTSNKKSASQTSISHFSSVSTNEYRSGWDAIFGSARGDKKKSSKKDNSTSLPKHITIKDQDIEDNLRALLYKAFQSQARREGVSLAKCNKTGIIRYKLECNITEK